MAVGAYDGQVLQPRLGTRGQSVQWLNVMNFNKTDFGRVETSSNQPTIKYSPRDYDQKLWRRIDFPRRGMAIGDLGSASSWHPQRKPIQHRALTGTSFHTRLRSQFESLGPRTRHDAPGMLPKSR